MKLAAVIIAVVCLAVTEASTLHDEFQGFDDLMYEGSSLSEEGGALMMAMLQGTKNCYSNNCTVCGTFSGLDKVCVVVRTSVAKVIFEIYRPGVNPLEVLTKLEYDNRSPRYCLNENKCIQVTGIRIQNHKLCASVRFNFIAVINNGCITLPA